MVNNESADIIRILYTAFDDLLPPDSPARGVTYYPAQYAGEIDELNGWIYDKVNNGVYKTGFAESQEVRGRRKGRRLRVTHPCPHAGVRRHGAQRL